MTCPTLSVVSFLSNRDEILCSLNWVVNTGTTKKSHLSTTSCSMLMFMLVTCSSKIILYITSNGSSTTFGLRYGSYDTIWRDNQEKEHEKITHRLSFHNGSWLETVIPARAKQPAMCLQPQEALGFVAAPSAATHNTITKRTTKVKFQVAPMGCKSKRHTRRDSKQR
jgi:hypothetical protein